MPEQKLQPVTDPAIEPRRLEEGKAFSYKARVEVLPVIEGVKYERLNILLINAVKEQQREIDQLKEQLRHLRAAAHKRRVRR